MKKYKILIPLAAVLLAAAGLLLSLSRQQNSKTQNAAYSFRTMGTAAAFSWFNVDEKNMLNANKLAMEAFDEVNKIANLYDRNSELSQLNRTAGKTEFVCSEMMWQMIKEAEFAFRFSNGAFDITVKPLMDLWGFYRKRGSAPTAQEIAETRKRTGFDKLLLNDQKRSIRFTVSGMALDLGGIAKGFALDLAARKVNTIAGQGVLDLGGNLKFLEHAPNGRNSYTVGIKDPAAPEKLRLTAEAAPGTSVSTSGDYERNVTYNGKVYGHIIHPEKGYPPPGEHSATVFAPSAMRADWLSTAVYLCGKELAEKAQKEIPGCRVILVKK